MMFYNKQRGNMSSIFSCNSEADSSELQENNEEIFLHGRSAISYLQPHIDLLPGAKELISSDFHSLLLLNNINSIGTRFL